MVQFWRQQDTNALTSKNLTYVSFSHLIWHPHFLQTVFFTGLDKPRCVRCIEKRSQTSVKTSRQQVQSGCENAVSSRKTNESNHKNRNQANWNMYCHTSLGTIMHHTSSSSIISLWQTVSNQSRPTLNLLWTPVSADKPSSPKNRESFPPQLQQQNGEKMTNISLSHV